MIDKAIQYYLAKNTEVDYKTFETPAHTFFKRLYWNRKDIEDIIPECKKKELDDNFAKLNIDVSEEQVNKYKDVLDTFKQIESAGLYTSQGLEYTSYNLFTKTGRPSNSIDGTNYAALNKEDGTRKKYTSRFTGGVLAEFDYDAYHLRLIANLIDYPTPSESFHKHLGKLYFDSDNLTDEQYKESKLITFRILYGGVPDEFMEIEYFKLVDDYISALWNTYNRKGYIETPILKKRFYKKNFDNLNSQKLFNYMIQAYETESNYIILKDIFKMLEGKESKMVLYIYDAFLFDISPSDGKEIMKEIKDIMKIPTTLHIGKNYHDMQNFDI
jgi:hypothetical protein